MTNNNTIKGYLVKFGLNEEKECFLRRFNRTFMKKYGILGDINPRELGLKTSQLQKITGKKEIDYNAFINDFMAGFSGENGYGKSYTEMLPDLMELFEKNHVIIFIDEFTEILGKLSSEDNSLVADFSFIDNLKNMGVSVVIAGHERMYYMLAESGGTNAVLAKSEKEPIEA